MECEELQASVQLLTTKNCTLREELQRLSQECERLTSENSSIKVSSSHILWPLKVLCSFNTAVNFYSLGKQEELTRLHGPEVIAALEQEDSATDQTQSK